MRARRPAPVLAVLAVVALPLGLTACTGDDPEVDPTETVTVTVGPDQDEAGPTGPAEPTTVVTETPDAEPLADAGPDDDAPSVANTEPDTSTGSGLVEATDLRFGRHDGYDRLVLDLGGAGEPSWRVEYVDEARGQGSGEVVPLGGDAILRMRVQGVMYPGEDGAADYVGPDVIVPPPGGAIREVAFDSVFEGTLEIFIGVAEQTPFRVYLLESPTRVVVDVQHP